MYQQLLVSAGRYQKLFSPIFCLRLIHDMDKILSLHK